MWLYSTRKAERGAGRGHGSSWALVCAGVLWAGVLWGGCARTNTRLGQDGAVPGDGDAPGDGATAVCGNGFLEPGEECDDGNQTNGDGCSAACTEELCDPSTCAEGCCGSTGQCVPGTQDEACGSGGLACADCSALGQVCVAGACQSSSGCSPGEVQDCGYCGERVCDAGGTWGSCDGQGDCGPGQVDITGSCGLCGELSRLCQNDCTWSGLACRDEGVCSPGEVEQGAPCGACAHQERTCQNDCTWSSWTCVTVQDCSPGDVDQGAACGNCGHQERTCQSDCTWGDWACVGQGECSAGDRSSQGCTCGEKVCSASCSWGPCQAPAEVCNGADDDCDGICDNGFACCQGQSEACTTSCGSTGTRQCDGSCSWGSCQAPAEVCNGADDDCDGVADEGWRAAVYHPTYTELAGHDASCDGSTERYGLACNRAIHGWCQAQGCEVSGFGPVENFGNDTSVTCVAGDGLRVLPWSVLQQEQPTCSSAIAISDTCYSAYHRYCVGQGYQSGFGPAAVSAQQATVVCVTGATVYHTDFTTLAGIHPNCDGVSEVVGPNCNAAIHRFCWQQHGHTSGFGPVEHNGNNVDVVCLDP